MGHPYLDGPHPRAYAHRGWHAGGGHENTMAAFGRAVDEGFGYVELDVHATAAAVAATSNCPDLGQPRQTQSIAKLPTIFAATSSTHLFFPSRCRTLLLRAAHMISSTFHAASAKMLEHTQPFINSGSTLSTHQPSPLSGQTPRVEVWFR